MRVSVKNKMYCLIMIFRKENFIKNKMLTEVRGEYYRRGRGQF